MFKLKNILWIGALMCTILSCDDYLNTPPENLMTSDGFYQTQTQSEQGIIGIYADLRSVSNDEYWHMSECRSDNSWVEPVPDALRDYSEIGTFRSTDNLALFNDVWNTWYKVIYDANVAIAKIPGCEFENAEIKDQFLNEAYFLRGWAYFELTRLFGNIPLVDKPMTPAEVKQVAQSAPKAVLETLVIPDLKKAEALPYKDAMKDAKGASIKSQGRADKLAAKSMLARVYMTLAGFPYNDANAKTLAKAQLESVLNDAQIAQYWAPTLDEWKKQWMPGSDYYNKYSIFAIQYRSGGTGNPAIFYMAPIKYFPASWSQQEFSNSMVYIEKSLMHEFDKVYAGGLKDGRGYGYSVLDSYPAQGNVAAYSSPKETMTFEDGTVADVYTRAIFYKYIPTKTKIQSLGLALTPESGMKKYDDWPVNYPVIRLEDMKLLYAELLVDGGNTAGAMKLVNEIRERANCDLVAETGISKEDAMKYIERERKIEFLGEGIRWFDQVRYGTWKSTTEAMFDRYNNPAGTNKGDLKDGRYLYPIPLNQMNVTPGLYKQNEGYMN